MDFDTDHQQPGIGKVETFNSKGPQGVDKAPGEEPAAAPDQFVQESQKGKKVDGDPSEEKDQPSTQSDI